MHDLEIARRFNAAFARSHRTVLIGGAAEPLYLPARGHRPALIRYTRDYAQSALHELAHWCLAGPQRRTRIDYGYWYQAPPRKPAQQRRFEAVETPVQGLELVMALATDVRFHVSADNPGQPDMDSVHFRTRILESALGQYRAGFSRRTRAVLHALNAGWANALDNPRGLLRQSAADGGGLCAEREVAGGNARG